jgi:hypothetical protein
MTRVAKRLRPAATVLLIGGLGSAIDAANQQPARIEQMLRFEVAGGPSAARIEFDAKKITDLPIHTVANLTEELPFGIADTQVGLQRDGLVELETGAGKRNILKVSYAPVNAPRLVLPVDIHHIRTQHPGLYAPVEHTLLIGEQKGNVYDRAGSKIALTQQ